MLGNKKRLAQLEKFNASFFREGHCLSLRRPITEKLVAPQRRTSLCCRQNLGR